MAEQRRGERGFTLIELLVVLTVIGILASIAVPNYQRSVIKAREAVLMEDLYQIRRAIDAYYVDQGKYPESLEALVEAKYLRGIPIDPITNVSDSWEIVAPTPRADGGELAEGGVQDVRSGSDLVGLNGTPYRDW